VRRTVIILLALVLAIGGAGLVFWYVSRADDRAIADEQPTTVWVAEQVVPSGTTLKDAESNGLITETKVPAKAVPTNAVTEITASNMALQALSDIAPGEFLLSQRFGTTPLGKKAINIPSGKIAVTVELTDPQGVRPFITPGSHIVVYRSSKLTPLGDAPRDKQIRDNDFKSTEVVLSNALVIGVDDKALAAPQQSTKEEAADAAGRAGGTSQGFLVTVAVTPEGSLLLVDATNHHPPLYAGLLGNDVKVDPKSSISDLNWSGGVES
jgi:pilus assembly protein CpaB